MTTYGTIYRIVCDASRKSYVGQTTLGTRRRFREHMTITARKACALGAAIRKYGRESFRVEELEQCASRQDLDAAEVRWISACGTLTPGGYNIAEGGSASRLSAETRAKISARASERALSPEWGAKISAAKLASGYAHSDEAREKMSAAKRGRVALNKGVAMSEAQRAKLRAAWVVRKAQAAQ